MVGGRKMTAATEKILMILFWLTLMKPSVVSSRNLILSKRKAVLAISDSESRMMSRRRSLCSAFSIPERSSR